MLEAANDWQVISKGVELLFKQSWFLGNQAVLVSCHAR